MSEQTLETQTINPDPGVVQSQPEPAPEIDESQDDALMAAAFDRAQAEGGDQQEDPEPEAEPAKAEPERAAAPDPVKTPEPNGDLPKALRDNWDKIGDEAAKAIAESHRELSRKVAQAARFQRGIEPIRSGLEQAIKDFPELSGLTPEQVMNENLELAKVNAAMRRDPVGTLMTVIDRYGIKDQMAARIGGTQTSETQALHAEINRLKNDAARFSNPDYLRQQFDGFNAQNAAQAEVSAFSANIPNWSDVEPHMVDAINFVRGRMPDTSTNHEVLAKAYDLVLTYNPDLKVEGAAAGNAAATNPGRVPAAIKAKSVNIASRSEGKGRQLTEDEEMAQAYDRAQAR